MRALQLLFGAIFAFMLGATIYTSTRQSLFIGGPLLMQNPWGVMTLFDAYFAFITFFVWVAYRERSSIARVLWFIAIMLLGNIAMSLYMLLAIARLPKGARIEQLLLRRSA
jgi:hypothetical protein